MVVGEAPLRRALTQVVPAPAPVAAERVPAESSRRAQPLQVDLPVVRAMADEFQAHGKALELLSAVASRAASLAPYEASLILGWVSATRAELQVQDPADKLIRLLRAAA